jgi:dTDP-4-amino-4,6-dideoxygalactose transaminase
MNSQTSLDDVSLANPVIGGREQRRVREVLESGQLAAGDEVEAFEDAFADYCGTEHAVATSNGTTALHAALSALDIGEGDRVLTTPLSFVATANAVRLAGGTPVFADVDARTFNLDPDAAQRRIDQLGGDIDAIMPVHLYGLPAAIDRYRELADRYDAALIEDAAQAHGATYRGEPVGSLGDAGCFSFYPTKNMTTGEGGMVVTDREDVAQRLRAFINHGRDPDDGSVHRSVGHNFRITDLAATIGRAQLDRLPDFVDARREHARRLNEGIDVEEITTPTEAAYKRHSYHQYTIRSSERDALADALARVGIDTGVYYPRPIHRQPAYDHVDERYPVAERLTDEVLSLPVHPSLDTGTVESIATAINTTDNDE